ncbi:GFA family protein [uncultured Sphingomonas sp.]|uniref:GFA family protein n=1 Tax=uncultured Sphingomonas sp. TaxID=158754 RepID=UPI0035CA8B15
MEWQAECNCGQLRATCTGTPDRISVCHCTNCKRRTGSAFGWNASFHASVVKTVGDYHSFARRTDSGRTNTYHFCPICGSTVFYDVEMRPGMTSVPAGAFASADFPKPTVQVFGQRRVSWCVIDNI